MPPTRKKVVGSHAGYMGGIYEPKSAILAEAREALHGVQFDTFVGRGISGVSMAFLLAKSMQKHFLLVRKPGDESHSDMTSEGEIGERWIFCDDFISGGTTFEASYQAVQEAAVGWLGSPSIMPVCVGAYLYQREVFKPFVGDDETGGIHGLISESCLNDADRERIGMPKREKEPARFQAPRDGYLMPSWPPLEVSGVRNVKTHEPKKMLADLLGDEW